MAKRCAFCNGINPDESGVCTYCGAVLPGSAPPVEKTAAPEPETSALTKALEGKYRLENRLGTGEHTEVYAAVSIKRKARRFALKCYQPLGEAERYMVSGLLQRAGKSRELKHENIVEVHGYVIEGDYYVVVMDVAEGHDAKTYLNKFGAMSPAEVWNTGRAILTALVYAHGQGMVHGNIKPSNVFLPFVSDMPVLVSDFGFGARGWNSTTTIYAAPEMLKGRENDPRSDQYSLGLVLFELFAGKLPFSITKSEDGRSLKRSRIDKTAFVTIPQPLRDVITRMLQREPEERFASAAEALDAMSPEQAKQLSRARAEAAIDEQRIRNLLSEADKAMEAQRPERAAEFLSQAARLNPNDMEIKAKLDKVNDALRQNATAEEALSAGQRAFKEKRYKDAVLALTKAEKLAPANVQITELLIRARQLLAEEKAVRKAPPTMKPTEIIRPQPKPPAPEPEIIPEPPPKPEQRPEPPPPPPAPPRREPLPQAEPPTVKPSIAPWKIFAGISTLFVVLIVVIFVMLMNMKSTTGPSEVVAKRPKPAPTSHVSTGNISPQKADDGDFFGELITDEPADEQSPAGPNDDEYFEQNFNDEEETERNYESAETASNDRSRIDNSAVATTAKESEGGFFDLEEIENTDMGEETPKSRSSLVFRTYPPDHRADVYVDNVHIGHTDRDVDGALPLMMDDVPAGVRVVKFVSTKTGEVHQKKVSVAALRPDVYVIQMEYEKPPEEEKKAPQPAAIPPAPPEEFAPPPQ